MANSNGNSGTSGATNSGATNSNGGNSSGGNSGGSTTGSVGLYCTDGGIVCTAPTPTCDNTSGQCVGCLTSKDCTGVGLTVCVAGNCAQCGSAADCPGDSPGCNGGFCGGCTTNSDCPGGQTCNGSQTCTCANKSQCSGDAPACTNGACGCTKNSDCPSGSSCDTNDYPNGACVGACSKNSDCSKQGIGEPFCQVDAGLCEQCLTAKDCVTAGLGGYCIKGNCEQCLSNTDCTNIDKDAGSHTPFCDQGTNQCVQCTGPGNCDTGAGCNSFTNTCGSCQINSDCGRSGSGLACNGSNHCSPTCIVGNSSNPSCAPCSADSDCPADAGFCVQSVGECSSNPNLVLDGGSCGLCGSGTVCDPSTQNCVGCLTNGDCSSPTPVCDTTQQSCVQCAQASDCPFNNLGCSNDLCGQCQKNADCPSGMTCGAGANLDNLCHCSASSQCGPPVPTCVFDGGQSNAAGGVCGCTASQQCPNGQACDLFDYVSGQCAGNCSFPDSGISCKDPFNICDNTPTSKTYGNCIQCRSDSNCTSSGAGKFCASGACVDCTKNSDCTGKYNTCILGACLYPDGGFPGQT